MGLHRAKLSSNRVALSSSYGGKTQRRRTTASNSGGKRDENNTSKSSKFDEDDRVTGEDDSETTTTTNTTTHDTTWAESESSKELRSAKFKLDLDKLLRCLEDGHYLSRIQIRNAFALYLFKIQARLLAESQLGKSASGEAGEDANVQQMELVMRFIKKASPNLSQEISVYVPSRRLPLGEQKRMLAKQLHDFLHVYRKDTEQIKCQMRELLERERRHMPRHKLVNEADFQALLYKCNEYDLEEIMSVYMKYSRDSSIFLGNVNAKCGACTFQPQQQQIATSNNSAKPPPPSQTTAASVDAKNTFMFKSSDDNNNNKNATATSQAVAASSSSSRTHTSKSSKQQQRRISCVKVVHRDENDPLTSDDNDDDNNAYDDGVGEDDEEEEDSNYEYDVDTEVEAAVNATHDNDNDNEDANANNDESDAENRSSSCNSHSSSFDGALSAAEEQQQQRKGSIVAAATTSQQQQQQQKQQQQQAAALVASKEKTQSRYAGLFLDSTDSASICTIGQSHPPMGRIRSAATTTASVQHASSIRASPSTRTSVVAAAAAAAAPMSRTTTRDNNNHKQIAKLATSVPAATTIMANIQIRQSTPSDVAKETTTANASPSSASSVAAVRDRNKTAGQQRHNHHPSWTKTTASFFNRTKSNRSHLCKLSSLVVFSCNEKQFVN